MSPGRGLPLPRPRVVLAVALLALAAFAPPALAQHPDLRFSRTGMEAGLPGDVVTAIHRDRLGFLWIGTRNGLARYDGYACVVYDNDWRNPRSLSDNVVRTIYEDQAGTLWIGTNAGGLNRFDRATGTFERFRHEEADPRSLSHDSVYVIRETRDGSLWVGTQRGLNRLVPGTGTFERFTRSDGSGLGNDFVLALHEDRVGRLWVGTIGALEVRDPDTGRFRELLHDDAVPTSLPLGAVFAFAEDAAGRLWVGTGRGVAVMDSWGSFRTQIGRGAEKQEVGGFLVSAFDGRGETLWVTGLAGALLEIDTSRETMYEHDILAGWSREAQPPRLPALHFDEMGNLWVGTWGQGLLQAHPAQARFSLTTARHRGPNVPPRVDATCAALDAKGRLWVGTFDLGLLRRDSPDGELRREDVGRLQVTSLAGAPDGTLWVGCSTGLLEYAPDRGTRVMHVHDSANARSLGAGFASALLMDRAGSLWIGTGGSGLYRRAADGGFERFAGTSDASVELTDDYVTRLVQDSRGVLWVGTRSGGLNAIDVPARKCVRFRPSPSPGSLSHHYVTSIAEDRRGRVWIGTSGGGLDVATPASANVEGLRFEVLSEADGLPDNDVMGIAADTDGSLWLSTKRGIARLRPDDRTFAAFGLPDGLPTLEFNSTAALETPTAVYFGSPLGLTETPTGTPWPTSLPSPLTITAIRRQGTDVANSAVPPPAGGIELEYRDWFSLEFAVLDLSPERNHLYEYRLDGAATPWIDIGRRRELTFVDLEPGTHSLEVRGRSSRGAWSSLASPLHIRVVPPFWMTSWFRALAACSLAGLAFAVHQGRMLALRRRNAELLRLQDERERALAEARRSEDRLRVLAGRLEAAKEEERKHLARELHDELGQSLTAVKVNLELAKRKPDTGDALARMEDSTRIVDGLITSVRSLSLDLRPPLMDEQGLAPALRSWLGELARRTGLEIELAHGAPADRLQGDIETAAFRIVQEAVTNAVRHAQATQVRVVARREGPWLSLQVEDDGRGFDTAAVLERAASGRHAGLLGMEERVRSCGGEMQLESAPGEGTTVRVRLPWRELP